MYGQMTAGSWILTAGLGGMGGAQPLAANFAGAMSLTVECQQSSIDFRLRTGYLDIQADGIDDAVAYSPVEELRWLEYGQRLRHQRRNVALSPTQRRVGEFLWQGALRGGAQASGRKVGALGVGMRADLLVLDSDHPNLDGAPPDDVLGAFIFAGNDNLVRDVLAGGRWVVRHARHIDQDAIARRYKQTLAELREYRS